MILRNYTTLCWFSHTFCGSALLVLRPGIEKSRFCPKKLDRPGFSSHCVRREYAAVRAAWMEQSRRGGRAVEGGRLESVCAGKPGAAGSNPALSATSAAFSASSRRDPRAAEGKTFLRIYAFFKNLWVDKRSLANLHSDIYE